MRDERVLQGTTLLGLPDDFAELSARKGGVLDFGAVVRVEDVSGHGVSFIVVVVLDDSILVVCVIFLVVLI